MSEIIERVAKAIEEELAYAIPQSAAYSRAARAAIAAMREPTKKMRQAGLDTGAVNNGEFYITSEHMSTIWHAMIDEALK